MDKLAKERLFAVILLFLVAVGSLVFGDHEAEHKSNEEHKRKYPANRLSDEQYARIRLYCAENSKSLRCR